MVSLFIIASIALLFYSYTQVDLALTLSHYSIFQVIQQWFQHIGYFNRPLSTGIFILLVLLFFILYWRALHYKALDIWRIIIPISVILLFSYPALSYDIFNYMFDAKTILVYHKIPYIVTPLQFTGIEPWLSFMHWTHIPSTFMPFWILLTLPAYLLGFGFFLTTLWSFKAIMVAGYIVTSWFIWKILMDIDPKKAHIGTALFALNPLVIFETLVSGHYDVVMMAFAVMSFYFYLHKKRVFSFLLLSLSIGTKLITGSLLPLFFIGWQRKLTLPFMLAGFAFFIWVTKREILPWYMIWFIPWYALLPRIRWSRTLGIGLSLGFLLSYAPFLYFGTYDPPVPLLKTSITLIFASISVVWLTLGKEV